MSVIVFTEEYTKSTKGTFNVIVNYVEEASKNKKIIVLTNSHHWGIEELKSIFLMNENVKIAYLPVILPSKCFLSYFKIKINYFQKISYLFGSLVDIFFMPIILTWLFIFLKLRSVEAIYSHNGGWPGGRLCVWIIIASYFAKIKNRILIIHSHPVLKTNNFYTIINFFGKTHILLVKKTATNIVTVSKSVKKEIEKIFLNKKIIKIHNGINEKFISFNKKDKFLFDKKSNYLGFIGEISVDKGVHVLIEAVNNILINTKLVLVGPKNLRDVKNFKNQSKISKNNIIYYGYSDNIRTFLKKIDILIVPAIAYESFSIVILEAMSQKKPVICSDYGGMKEIVIHGETGLIVEANNPIKLYNAINKLVFNKKLQKQMGYAGYNRYKTLFTAKVMFKKYENLIR